MLLWMDRASQFATQAGAIQMGARQKREGADPGSWMLSPSV